MTFDLVSILVLVFAVLPGLAGYWTYQAYFGSNWRQTQWEKALAVVLISALGLGFYIVLSPLLGLPAPLYVLPSTFTPATFASSTLYIIALSYLGHTVSSEIVAIFVIIALRTSGRWLPASPFPGAWDDFVRNKVRGHWVIVRLNNGDAYAGIVSYADVSVNQQERDIVLLEPALFDKRIGNYIATPYQYMFLSAAIISSIASVTDYLSDNRITSVNTPIFRGGKKNVRRKSTGSTA